MGLPARRTDETPWIRRGTDQWGNAIWFWNDKLIRVDETGPKRMLCLKDGFEANGLTWSTLSNRQRLKDHIGSARFATPGGAQTLATITPEGFNLLVMRSNKPFSEDFRRWLAGIAGELGEKGYVDIRGGSPALASSSPMDLIVQQISLLHQTAIQLADQARRVDQLEARVDQIEQRGEEATKEALSLPAPSVSAPARTDRHNIVEWVRGFCWSTGADFKACFGKLYTEVKYRLGVDVNVRFRNNPDLYDNKLDVLDSAGLLDKVYALARELFPWEPKLAE